MSSCIALVQCRAFSSLWSCCARDALRGDRYCANHRQALNGIVMGYLDTKECRLGKSKQLAKLQEKARRARKKLQRKKRRAARRDRSSAASRSGRVVVPKQFDPLDAFVECFCP